MSREVLLKYLGKGRMPRYPGRDRGIGVLVVEALLAEESEDGDVVGEAAGGAKAIPNSVDREGHVGEGLLEDVRVDPIEAGRSSRIGRG